MSLLWVRCSCRFWQHDCWMGMGHVFLSAPDGHGQIEAQPVVGFVLSSVAGPGPRCGSTLRLFFACQSYVKLERVPAQWESGCEPGLGQGIHQLHTNTQSMCYVPLQAISRNGREGGTVQLPLRGRCTPQKHCHCLVVTDYPTQYTHTTLTQRAPRDAVPVVVGLHTPTCWADARKWQTTQSATTRVLMQMQLRLPLPTSTAGRCTCTQSVQYACRQPTLTRGGNRLVGAPTCCVSHPPCRL